MRRKKRGRFDVVCVFDSGAWVRITSDPKRSIPAADLIKELRDALKTVAAGIAGEQRQKRREKWLEVQGLKP